LWRLGVESAELEPVQNHEAFADFIGLLPFMTFPKRKVEINMNV